MRRQLHLCAGEERQAEQVTSRESSPRRCEPCGGGRRARLCRGGADRTQRTLREVQGEQRARQQCHRPLDAKEQREREFEASVKDLPLLEPGQTLRADEIGFGFRVFSNDILDYNTNGDVRVVLNEKASSLQSWPARREVRRGR